MLQNLFKSIPAKRLFLYAILLGLLPLTGAAYILYAQREAVHSLESKMELVRHQALLKEQKQSLNLAVRCHNLGADHFYIDKQVESIPLLEAEIEALKKVLDQQYLVENEAAKKRLEYLENSNKIVFTEGMVESFPYFHETSETLTKPVEANVSDLEQILSKIEGVEIGPHTPEEDRPQMIITEFKMDKKKIGGNNEIFLLNLKLLKREFF